jgi:glycosyltransferase involved in cell wall biosynthesis
LPDIQTDVFLIFRLFANHDGQCLAELRHRTEQLGVAERVRWIDEVPVEQLPELYALADVIVNYPSLDTFPITFMEAAACERPVITCRLPSYLNIFAEKCFRMVQPENVEDLARAMTEFVHQTPSEMERQRLSLSEARREVMSKYDATVYARGLTSIYKKVVGRSASSAID